MNQFEQIGYYDWDDELNDHDSDNEQIFYYAEHIMPEDSSIANKMQVNNKNSQQFYQNSRTNYNNYHKFAADSEHISQSSHAESHARPQHRNRLDSGLQEVDSRFDSVQNCYPHSSRQYLANDFGAQQQELLTITVEIGNGEKENIVVLTTDTPEDVADRFWGKYDMTDELRDIFVEQIAHNIEHVKREIESNDI